MIIKQDQITKISNENEKKFIQNCLDRINRKFPDGFKNLGVTKEDEKKIVIEGIKSAKSYGIVLEIDFLFYLECIIMLGLEFDKNDLLGWPKKILNNQNLTGESKMNLISDHIVFNISK